MVIRFNNTRTNAQVARLKLNQAMLELVEFKFPRYTHLSQQFCLRPNNDLYIDDLMPGFEKEHLLHVLRGMGFFIEDAVIYGASRESAG